MKIRRGDRVQISHARKGMFLAMALEDFDTENETFFPVAVATKPVWGLSENWGIGEQIACRGSLVTNITVVGTT